MTVAVGVGRRGVADDRLRATHNDAVSSFASMAFPFSSSICSMETVRSVVPPPLARTSSVASDTSLAPDWTFVLTSATRIVADEPSSLTELSVSPSASGNETPVIDAISGFET